MKVLFHNTFWLWWCHFTKFCDYGGVILQYLVTMVLFYSIWWLWGCYMTVFGDYEGVLWQYMVTMRVLFHINTWWIWGCCCIVLIDYEVVGWIRSVINCKSWGQEITNLQVFCMVEKRDKTCKSLEFVYGLQENLLSLETWGGFCIGLSGSMDLD